MACEEFEDRILESLDRPLPEQFRRRLEEHVAACAACREFRTIQRSLDDALRAGLTPPAASPQFRRRLLHRVSASAGFPRWADFLDLVGCVGFAVAAAFFFYWLGMDRAALAVWTSAAASVFIGFWFIFTEALTRV